MFHATAPSAPRPGRGSPPSSVRRRCRRSCSRPPRRAGAGRACCRRRRARPRPGRAARVATSVAIALRGVVHAVREREGQRHPDRDDEPAVTDSAPRRSIVRRWSVPPRPSDQPGRTAYARAGRGVDTMRADVAILIEENARTSLDHQSAASERSRTHRTRRASRRRPSLGVRAAGPSRLNVGSVRRGQLSPDRAVTTSGWPPRQMTESGDDDTGQLTRRTTRHQGPMVRNGSARQKSHGAGRVANDQRWESGFGSDLADRWFEGAAHGRGDRLCAGAQR